MKISSYFLGIAVVSAISISACVHDAAPLDRSGKVKNIDNIVSSEIYEGFRTAQVNEVLILPVLVRSNVDGVLTSPEEVLGIPDKNNTEILINAFDVNTNLPLVDTNNLAGTDYWSLLSNNGLTREGLFKRAGEIAKSHGMKNIIFCMLDDKDMRTGGGYGSQRSSSLAYRIWLYDSQSDKVIWSSAYQSKEESLTSNLFEFGERLESGIGFKTSQELIKLAFKNSAEKLNRDLTKSGLKK